MGLTCAQIIGILASSKMSARRKPLAGVLYFRGASMPRLTTIKPRLAAASMRRVSTITEERDTYVEARGWYKLARWKAEPPRVPGLRWRVLVRDLFTCQMCGKLEVDTSLLVGDHKVPHRGDPDLFWSEANVWCLCKTCHDSVKQRQERASWR